MWPLTIGEESCDMVRVRCLSCGAGGVTERYDDCVCWKCGEKIYIDAYDGLVIVLEEKEEPRWKWLSRKWLGV